MLLGPFTQVLTMDGLPAAGPISDDELRIIPDAGIRVADGYIQEIGPYQEMGGSDREGSHFSKTVAVPGLIDTHTHICYAGSRARDYALRVSGVSYQQIAAAGGGILDTVRQTRKAGREELSALLTQRADTLLLHGVTTCEVKSGYGLSVEEELKLLEVIDEVRNSHSLDLVATCLAAHTRPPEFDSNQEYLKAIVEKLFPLLKERKLSDRIDIFVDEHAFTVDEARWYLMEARRQGFAICMHADQFNRGGAQLAAELKALSADHLEHTNEEDAEAMRRAGVIPVVLPGATLGLGIHFPPARMLLDKGLPLVIASDWNPGSAPMGYLLAQAALLGAAQHLTMAETWAAITSRAARALSLPDRGALKVGQLADIVVFPAGDYREILYHQGALKPSQVYKRGVAVC